MINIANKVEFLKKLKALLNEYKIKIDLEHLVDIVKKIEYWGE